MTEQHAEDKVEKKSRHTKKSPSLSRWLLSSVILTILAGTIAYGWQLYSHLQSQLSAQAAQLQAVQDAQSMIDGKLRARLKQQTQQLAVLTESLNTFINNNRHVRHDWLLAEAEYLIKLANHRLLLVRDVKTAIQALKAADDRLREVGNPALIPLRKSLATDIQALNNVPYVDQVGLSLTLNTLSSQVDRLPLKTPDPQTIKQRNNAPSKASQVTSWKELPAAVWQDFLSLFKIKKYNEPLQALLSPEQRFFLQQNLKLQFEQARLALLNNEAKIYQDRLAQSKQWLLQYFDTKHTSTQSVLNTLDTLAQQNISPELPDISISLQDLHLLQSGNADRSVKTVKINPEKNKKTIRKTPARKKMSEQQGPVKKAATKTKPGITRKPASAPAKPAGDTQ